MKHSKLAEKNTRLANQLILSITSTELSRENILLLLSSQLSFFEMLRLFYRVSPLPGTDTINRGRKRMYI
jgi:hypothetical protein